MRAVNYGPRDADTTTTAEKSTTATTATTTPEAKESIVRQQTTTRALSFPGRWIPKPRGITLAHPGGGKEGKE
ncbi:hypothetical protein RRF57_008396 [Xylaria bambusicola]|uniref:Uncharacterized protein n=1 Tax=Xylaria bambusicola TaxID=326684 RepID=A0AAN7UPC2_9PEZI